MMTTEYVYVECPHCLVYSTKYELGHKPYSIICPVCGTEVRLND